MDIHTLRKSFSSHWDKATAIRMLSVDGVEKANSGHPGMPMGMADVVTVLFEKHLKFLSSEPNWLDSCLLYTSPSPRDGTSSRMPSSA